MMETPFGGNTCGLRVRGKVHKVVLPLTKRWRERSLGGDLSYF